MRPDGPKLLLDLVVRLLPTGGADWGRAMRAELDTAVPHAQRWSFAAGAAATVLRQFTVLRSLTYTVITEAAVVVAVMYSRGIGYAPLRWRELAVVAALTAVSILGRTRGPLGPLRRDTTARMIRGAGFVVIMVAATGLLTHAPTMENPQEASIEVTGIGAILACWLAALVAVTADRSAATSRTLRWGALSGVVAALARLTAVFVNARVPYDIGLAGVLLIVAIAAAGIANGRHPIQGWIAALTAGAVGTLLTVIELVVLSGFAPPPMIPNLAPPRVTGADALELSRSQLQDPYVAVFFLSGLITLVLGILAVSTRTHHKATATQVDLAHPDAPSA